MPVLIRGFGGVDAEVDEARNIQVFQGIPGYPAAGGWYSVSGKSGAAAIAAALATDTTLMSARFSTGSTRKAYITGGRVIMATLTPGAAGGVPSVLGLQRFSGATPTSGTPRSAHRFGPSKGSVSDMTDIRDNNAALTVTGVTFGEEASWSITPTHGTNVTAILWDILKLADAPMELSAGDGICLRTRQVGPATATWYFSYVFYWFER